METWKCERCGLCCTKMVSSCQTPDWLKGVALTKREIHWFSKAKVNPCLGVRLGDQIIVLDWLLVTEPCPNYINGGCLIWDYAPKVCRSFPYIAKVDEKGHANVTMSNYCPAAMKLVGKESVGIPKRVQSALKELIQHELWKKQKYGACPTVIWKDEKWEDTGYLLEKFHIFYNAELRRGKNE